jgi:hypothetical protein
VTGFSSADLKVILAIIEKYQPDAAELAESGEIHFDFGPAEVSGYRRR